MYSKSANVNDLGFAWTGWPSSLHGPALLLVPTVFLPGGLPCPSATHCTIPTSALVFGGNIFTHPCVTISGLGIDDPFETFLTYCTSWAPGFCYGESHNSESAPASFDVCELVVTEGSCYNDDRI